MNSPPFEDQQRQNTKPDIPLSLLLLDATFPSVCIETWLNSHHILELWGIMMRDHSVEFELGVFLYFSRCHPPGFRKSPSSAMSRREVTLRVFLPAENGGPRDASALKKMEKRLTLHDFTMIFQLGVAKIYLSEGCWTHYKNLKSGIWPSGEKNWNICGARNNPKLLRLICPCGQGQIFVRVHWFKLFFLYRSRNWQAQTIRWGFGFATASYSRKEAKTGRGDGLWLVVARKLRKGNGCVRK